MRFKAICKENMKDFVMLVSFCKSTVSWAKIITNLRIIGDKQEWSLVNDKDLIASAFMYLLRLLEENTGNIYQLCKVKHSYLIIQAHKIFCPGLKIKYCCSCCKR